MPEPSADPRSEPLDQVAQSPIPVYTRCSSEVRKALSHAVAYLLRVCPRKIFEDSGISKSDLTHPFTWKFPEDAY